MSRFLKARKAVVVTHDERLERADVEVLPAYELELSDVLNRPSFY